MPIQFCQLQMHRNFRKEDCIVSATTAISVIRIMLCDSYRTAAESSYLCSQAWRWSTEFWEKKAYLTKNVNNDFCFCVLKKLCNWISFMGSFWVGVKGNTENSCDEDKPLGQVLYVGQNCDIDLEIQTSWVLCRVTTSLLPCSQSQEIRKKRTDNAGGAYGAQGTIDQLGD